MIVLGDVGVGAVHVLGDRADLVLGEAAERVPHELEVVVEVVGARAVRRPSASASRNCGVAVRGDERRGRRRGRRARRPTCASRPTSRRRRRRPRRRRRRGRARLDLAVLAVVEHDAGDLDRGRGVGEVVGEDLVLVDRARGEHLCCGLDDLRSLVDDAGGGLQITGEVGHPAEATDRPISAPHRPERPGSSPRGGGPATRGSGARGAAG